MNTMALPDGPSLPRFGRGGMALCWLAFLNLTNDRR